MVSSGAVIVTGASGILGSHLVKSCPYNWGVSPWGLSHGDENILVRHDLMKPAETYRAIKETRANLIIHCAGNGLVDFSQKEPEKARQINLQATINVMAAATELKAHFVYISSNAVYSGENPPYAEESDKNPINEYGRIKLEAERVVAEYQHKKTIIRPIFLYGHVPEGSRTHMDTRVIKTLSKGERLDVAYDIITQPTYAEDCAKAIWDIVKNQYSNSLTVNIGGPETISLYGFALKVAEVFGLDRNLITPRPSSFFKGTYAPRPFNTTFDLTRLNSLVGPLRGVEEGLKAMKETYAT